MNSIIYIFTSEVVINVLQAFPIEITGKSDSKLDSLSNATVLVSSLPHEVTTSNSKLYTSQRISVKISSLKHLRNINNSRNNNSNKCCNTYCSSCNVFDLTYFVMKVWMYKVCYFFYCCI